MRVENKRTPCACAVPYTNENMLFNNELKTEMTIIPLANRARSHIALARPVWV